jgi:hypothetical protein
MTKSEATGTAAGAGGELVLGAGAVEADCATADPDVSRTTMTTRAGHLNADFTEK